MQTNIIKSKTSITALNKSESANELQHLTLSQYKRKKLEKEIYRPVNIPWNLSKVYKKLIYNQLYDFFHTKLCTSQWRFQKEFSVQHWVLVMTEEIKEAMNKGK